jgi:hypothetical protein
MTGYYLSKSDDSVYHVYCKGFDYYAQCVKSIAKPINQPFKINPDHIQTYLKRESWVPTTKPEIETT